MNEAQLQALLARADKILYRLDQILETLRYGAKKKKKKRK